MQRRFVTVWIQELCVCSCQLIFNASLFLPFSNTPIFSQTEDIFVIIIIINRIERRLSGTQGHYLWSLEGRKGQHLAPIPPCISDSWIPSDYNCAVGEGVGADWGFFFSQYLLLLHHQSRVAIFSRSRCMAAALAQDGDQNQGGWNISLCLSRQQDEHQLADLLLLPHV